MQVINYRLTSYEICEVGVKIGGYIEIIKKNLIRINFLYFQRFKKVSKIFI